MRKNFFVDKIFLECEDEEGDAEAASFETYTAECLVL